MADQCIVCGCEVPLEGDSMCDTCWDLAAFAKGIDSWPVGFGLSIRRFLRREEVADLRRDVLKMTVEAAAAALHGAGGEDVMRRQAKALDRLTALALEGHE